MLKNLYTKHLPEVNQNKLVQNSITFLIKEGRNSVANWRVVSSFLKKYAKMKGLLYEQCNLQEVSFTYQLKLLARTKILITNGGSTAFSSFFLRRNTVVIYFPIRNRGSESALMRKFPERFLFIPYSYYDRRWLLNIVSNDNSFEVKLRVLEVILNKLYQYYNHNNIKQWQMSRMRANKRKKRR